MRLVWVTAVFCLLSSTALAQTGSSKSVSTLTTEINNSFPSGCSGCVTAQVLRQVELDIINSFLNNSSAATFTLGDLVVGGPTTGQVQDYGAPRQVVNVAALRGLPFAAVASGTVVQLMGNVNALDHGGGVYDWQPNSTADDDNGIVIKPAGNSGSGRWIRRVTEVSGVPVEVWGAVPFANSVISNSTNAIQAACNWSAGNVGAIALDNVFYADQITTIGECKIVGSQNVPANATQLRHITYNSVLATTAAGGGLTGGPYFIRVYAFDGSSNLLHVLHSGSIALGGNGTINASWNAVSGIGALGTIVGGSGYTGGTYNNVPLMNGSGTEATANITVTGGSVSAVTLVNFGWNYQIGDVLTASQVALGNNGGSGFSVPVASLDAATSYTVYVDTSNYVMTHPTTSTTTSKSITAQPAAGATAPEWQDAQIYVRGQNSDGITIDHIALSGQNFTSHNIYTQSGNAPQHILQINQLVTNGALYASVECHQHPNLDISRSYLVGGLITLWLDNCGDSFVHDNDISGSFGASASQCGVMVTNGSPQTDFVGNKIFGNFCGMSINNSAGQDIHIIGGSIDTNTDFGIEADALGVAIIGVRFTKNGSDGATNGDIQINGPPIHIVGVNFLKDSGAVNLPAYSIFFGGSATAGTVVSGQTISTSAPYATAITNTAADIEGFINNGNTSQFSLNGATLFDYNVSNASNFHFGAGINMGAQNIININAASAAGYIVGGSIPSNAGTCGILNKTGGNSAGTFTLNGACNAGTISLGFSITANNGWSCRATDETTPTDTFNQTAQSATGATFTGTGANNDTISYSCVAY